MIKGLHHNAYRCRDAEETRKFYEDFLGLPLSAALELRETKTGRQTSAMHIFFMLGDGSFLAFFEAPAQPFEFKPQHDYDLHIALEVPYEELGKMLEKGKGLGIESRGISDHNFIHSVYFRDPNGYIIELASKLPHHDREVDPSLNGARERLAAWQAEKASRPPE